MLHTDKAVRAKVTCLKKDKYKEERSCSEEKMSLELAKDKLKLITCNVDRRVSFMKTLF